MDASAVMTDWASFEGLVRAWLPSVVVARIGSVG